jgi:hypothetical protein
MTNSADAGNTDIFARCRETVEGERLNESAARTANWLRWGPYLADRQWATVREDYSEFGTCWDYFPHDHARSRAYRWGEDGLLGFADRQCRLCFSLALWNGRDPILKERLFGLTNEEGNHGEDAKEMWFYLDSTPTHSYAKALYKYPQTEFPYERLVAENRRRGKDVPEFELADAGAFDYARYFDVTVEYAKAAEEDILIRVEIANRGPVPAEIHFLPTFWFRNTWSWGTESEAGVPKPLMKAVSDRRVMCDHVSLGQFFWEILDFEDPEFRASLLFTENETNYERLFGTPNPTPFVKDAFHDFVIGGRYGAVNPAREGTKSAAWCRRTLAPGEARMFRLRLRRSDQPETITAERFETQFALRRLESDQFYSAVLSPVLSPSERSVSRQAYAGLLWSKQFYHYIVQEWLAGDPLMPKPPAGRETGRNRDWRHLYARDILSMPDKWEYPWFAAWDTAFHMIPFARLDGEFAKSQLSLFLREWYMHPNGQIPAYEFAFGDVNPPVMAWAVWRVYKITGCRGGRDREFLESAFQKLLLNFTWWVNRKDSSGNNLFSGGFLGLDNIGVFDRSQPLPGGGALQQADGTAWMAFYAATMLAMAIELAHDNGRVVRAYEDMASKFLEHFVQIAEAMNTQGGAGLWDERDGFYYDRLVTADRIETLRTRSMVGLLPLIAVEVFDEAVLRRLPGFAKRLDWFVRNKHSLSRGIALGRSNSRQKLLLAIPTKERLLRLLAYLGDESEFLSHYGVRSLSKYHEKNPFVFEADGVRHQVDYVPGESNTHLFGGNSNWRGPIWFPVNYLLIEALERYQLFYGDEFKIEYPTGSKNLKTLGEIAADLEKRLAGIFFPDDSGCRPCFGQDPKFSSDPHWRGLVNFHEFFHAETGRGCGANHQTGWTALVVRCIEDAALVRVAAKKGSASVSTGMSVRLETMTGAIS